MAISVVDPVSFSVERTKEILFRPIQAGKWFVLGFCAWLAEIGSGGGSGLNFGGNGGGGRGGGAAPAPVPASAPGQGQGAPPGALPPGMRPAIDWVQANLPLVIAIGMVVVVLVVVIWLLLAWVQSRFRFIFLDNVVRDRTEVAEPWREFRREGDSLFGFNVIFSLGSLLAFAIIVGGALLLALHDIRAHQFGEAAILALVVGIPTFIATLLAVSVVRVFLHDFVVPIMYLRRQGVMASWTDFRTELLDGRVGTFVLYFLFRGVVLTIAVGFIGVGITCLTCCIAALPYIGSVILLPLSVFLRQYSLYYLEQFGPGWQFFAQGKPPAGDLEFLDV